MDVAVTSLKDFLALEDTKAKAAKVQAGMEADPVINAKLEKAESEEDLYEIFKHYISMKVEDAKKLFGQVADYFKEDKVKLSDDVMDSVVGGWSFGSFFEKYKKAIIATAIVVGGAVIFGAFAAGVGAVIGVCAAAEGIGTVAGWVGAATVTGAVLGAGAGALTARDVLS